MGAFAEFFRRLLASDFMPHGHCFFWQADILWLHVVSDSLIVLAYYSIPATLLYVIRQRPGMRLNGLILMFGGFILACGTTHLISVWNLWHSAYRLEGLVKAITAMLSLTTAIAALKLAPQATKIGTPDEMAHVGSSLQEEAAARKVAEHKHSRHMKADELSSEAQLRSFFEAAPLAILAVSSDGVIVLVNQRTEQVFGYAREELLGQQLELLLPERYRATHVRHRSNYFAEPHVRPTGTGMDLSGRRKDGSEFPIEIGLSFIETEQGRLALGLVSDITERKRSADQLARAHADLRSREAQLRSFLEAAPQAIVAVGGDGRIQLVNQRTEELFGYARPELLGQGLELLLPDRYRVAHVGHRGGYFNEPRVRNMGQGMDLAGRRKDGTEFPVEIGLSCVETDDGTLALGFISDITERKRSEMEIIRVNLELRRTNTELEQFVYVASHDLQEPLRTIASYLRLLERRYRHKFDQDGLEFLHYAVDGAQRMKSLIQDLLHLSRAGTESLHLQPVSATALVETAMLNLAAAIEDCGAVVTQDPLPSVSADAGLLTQVFQNMIGNALKFRARDIRPMIHISARVRQSECEFSVGDSGIGIEPQHTERIFRLFERLHTADQYPGSGVGLAISQKIVARHGGRIRLESKVGQGSTFYFSIPTGNTPVEPQAEREERR